MIERDNVYLRLTREMNEGRLRAVISSGQAVVLHGLAIMSKDGDWILREDEEAMAHVLSVLARHGARYRFGAPLDVRWLRGGWSAHLEFSNGVLRVRTDFVTRPPRLEADDLGLLWRSQEGKAVPVVGIRQLVELKKTDREKDYVAIGELARRLEDPAERLLCSRSARDILALAAEHPALSERLSLRRPVLAEAKKGQDALEVALDAERRALVRANEARLFRYERAAEPFAASWAEVAKSTAGLPLPEAHQIVVRRAEALLSFSPAPEGKP